MTVTADQGLPVGEIVSVRAQFRKRSCRQVLRIKGVSAFARSLPACFNSRQYVITFNTAEGWSRDVSEDIADEIARRCAIGWFVARHGKLPPQRHEELPLPPDS